MGHPPFRLGLRGAVLALIFVTLPRPVRAEDAPEPTNAVQGSASSPVPATAPESPPPEPPQPEPSPSEDHRTGKIRSLIAESLDPNVAPQSLFEIPLDDEAAIQVEAARLRALIKSIDDQEELKRTAPASPHAKPKPATEVELPEVDPALWKERMDLDRQRLEFYSLTPERRLELLRTHDLQVEAARPQETEPERLAREAELERQRSLEAARVARSDAERMVQEEIARLIGLGAELVRIRAGFQGERAQIALRREAIIGWQRRGRDAKLAGSSESDATYDALRRSLRASRDDLSASLDDLSSGRSDVPVLWDDSLADIPVEISTGAARERRRTVQVAILEAKKDELALRDQRASALLDEIDSGNRERLALLSHLSREKREAITGFTRAGWDQARSEARHLSLILRYHQHVARTWFNQLRGKGNTWTLPWRALTSLTPLLIAVVLFFWAKKHTRSLLALAELRLLEADRAENRTSPSSARRLVRFLLKVHAPLERVAFFLLGLSLLPDGTGSLLEVQLFASILGWSLTGALIVSVIDTIASARNRGGIGEKNDDSGRIRLRSLRLVGRTVVGFGLVLVLSTRLVGAGTIYAWVFAGSWFAAIPIFLLLVRWWRGTIFERLDRVRKKTPIQAWILSKRSGWRSFLAAMLGAIQLFSSGFVKLILRWISEFDLARRADAYLVKRKIEKIRDGGADADLAPLPDEALLSLHPELPPSEWLSCPSDKVLAVIASRVQESRGGLVAVIGARGMGKSSLLRALAEGKETARIVNCTRETSLADLRKLGATEGDLEPSPTRPPGLVLLDEAQALMQPRIGGFEKFDAAIALARESSDHVTWVFSIDASVWPLLRRARDARPMFDEIHTLTPWNERQIGALLQTRCKNAGIQPSFEDLLEKLPPGSDEIDRQDALAAKRAGYERMLWDHVGGNPALALEGWRSSLAGHQDGHVHVRPLRLRDTATLERLPNTSLFVLRAVLQLAPASVEVVAEVTRLRTDEVLQDFRFGRAQGYFDEQPTGMRVAWPWLRAVTRLLERRRLLGVV